MTLAHTQAFDEWRKICYCLAPLFADGNLSQSPERLRKVDALFLSARLYMCDVVPAVSSVALEMRWNS